MGGCQGFTKRRAESVQMGDLYPRWVGARELLLHQRNPYSEEISHENSDGLLWAHSYA